MLRSKFFAAQTLAVLLFGALFTAFCGTAAAQSSNPTPKWELFGGYSWTDPAARLRFIGNPFYSSVGPVGSPLSLPIQSQNRGFGTGLTYNFNRWLGLASDFSANYANGDHSLPNKAHADLFSLGLGPQVTFPSRVLSPFIHSFVAWNRLDPDGLSSNNKVGFLAGGGVDWKFSPHVAWRIVQADWMYSQHRFAPSTVAGPTTIDGRRIETGLVWMSRIGPPPPPPAASCSVDPAEVNAGEPVKATATTSNFRKNAKLTYDWSSTGGKVAGSGDTASVDTTGLAPGSYTVTAKVSDGKKGNAECTSNFSVKEPPKNPPTVSCSSNPDTVKSGESSTITCTCTSPDNRQVSLSNWTASSGKVTGSGNTATLDTAGAAAGPVNISATCSDDRGLTAQGSSTVNVENPPPPPQASKLNEITFKKNSARVDNQAKAVLDQVADSLQQDPNAKAAIVGEHAASEHSKLLAEHRAVNAKAYLTSGENQKAIDPSRISVYTGTDDAQTDQIWMIPQGATFDTSNLTPVDESKIKPQGLKAHAVKHAAHKKAKKAATTGGTAQ